MTAMASIFGSEEIRSFPYQFRGRLHVPVLAGGTPTNPDVAEAWLKFRGAKGRAKDQLLAAAVAEVMADRGLSPDQEDEAIEEVSRNRHLTGFKRDQARDEQFYIESRQLKACIKEAVSVAADVGKLKPRGLGQNNRKGILSFTNEHVFAWGPDDAQRLYLETKDHKPVTEPTEIRQGFVSTFRGTGISLKELVEDAQIDFRIETDYEFTSEEWAMIWTTAERQGIGASRSQSYGAFSVIEWEPLVLKRTRKAA